MLQDTVKLRNLNLKILPAWLKLLPPMIDWDSSLCCSTFLPVKAV